MHVVSVPWARPGSGFTLSFEAFILTLASAMPVARIARLVGEHDTRLWRLLKYHVDEARRARDDRDVQAVGIDEPAGTPLHQSVDLEQRRLLFATPGRDATTVERFADDLAAHGGDPATIREVCCGMSPALLKGIAAALPKAAVTFDKFHLMMNRAVDETRRAERRTGAPAQGEALCLPQDPG